MSIENPSDQPTNSELINYRLSRIEHEQVLARTELKEVFQSGFNQLNDRFDKLETRTERLEDKADDCTVTKVEYEGRLSHVESRVNSSFQFTVRGVTAVIGIIVILETIAVALFSKLV